LGCNTFVHGSNARNLSIELSLTQLAKTLVFLIIAFVFSSTKLKIRAEQVLHGSKGVGGKERGWEAGGRNGPNNVCTYE
jgi:hypothetical protein